MPNFQKLSPGARYLICSYPRTDLRSLLDRLPQEPPDSLDEKDDKYNSQGKARPTPFSGRPSSHLNWFVGREESRGWYRRRRPEPRWREVSVPSAWAESTDSRRPEAETWAKKSSCETQRYDRIQEVAVSELLAVLGGGPLGGLVETSGHGDEGFGGLDDLLVYLSRRIVVLVLLRSGPLGVLLVEFVP